MANKPQTLTPEQVQVIREVNDQHPKSWTRGTWYDATMAGKPVQIRRTRSRGVPYLGIRKEITVHLKTPAGEILSTRKAWEYYTVNLREYTMTAQGY